MPYFLCDEQERHINDFSKDLYKYADPPLSEYKCGANGCDGVLRPERYINPPKSGQLYKPKPIAKIGTPIASTPVITTFGLNQGNAPNINTVGATASVVFGGLANFVPVRPEAETQRRITEHYARNGANFLCRNGSFAPYQACKWPVQSPLEAVDEPGFVKGQSLKYDTYLIGRLEIGTTKAPFGHVMPAIVKGQTTYPDLVVEISKVVYAIELKTPRIDLKTYMTEFEKEKKIYKEDGVEVNRSITEELVQRRENIPKHYESVILFDLANLKETLQESINILKSNIGHFTWRKDWWLKHINGVVFCYNENGTEIVSRRFTIDEILDKATDSTSTLQQTNLKSFFGSSASINK